MKEMYKDQYEQMKIGIIDAGKKIREGYRDLISAIGAIPLFLDEGDKEEEKEKVKWEVERCREVLEHQNRNIVRIVSQMFTLLILLARRRKVELPWNEAEQLRDVIDIF